ncbi:MAG: YbaB/EbfC family nucleoid-associated protein, partial [Clostridiales bacterium]|nr:YbaB/EbfC family nucleoid-associated protein [Clostridiales bacterium]
MKQAQKMQQQIADKQEELEARTLEVTSGGGAV